MQTRTIIMGLLAFLKILTGCSNSSLFFNYGYNIKDGQVFYKQPFPNPVIRMEGVDVKTFKEMQLQDSAGAVNAGFAVDKNAVYYNGWKVAGSDGASFQMIDVNYAKDKYQCYYRGSVIVEADPATFSIRNDHFSIDKSHVFRNGIIIDNDPSVLEIFNDGYMARTANAVAVYSDIVPIHTGETFKYLGYSYFALNRQLYFHNEPLPADDSTGFIALDNFFSKTDRAAFYGDKVIKHAVPSSFRLLEAPYSTDGHHIFFFERMIEDADVKTFEILNSKFQCARDKHAAYHEDKKVTHFTGADLENKNPCTNCNADNIYFAE